MNYSDITPVGAENITDTICTIFVEMPGEDAASAMQTQKTGTPTSPKTVNWM